MNYKENDIELLLPRYCEGLSTLEERQRVEDWIQESEENRRVVKQMQMLYLAVDSVNVIGKVNTEKALAKVKGKRIVRKRVTWWEWTQRVAAVLFLPLLIAYLVESNGAKTEGVRMLEARTNPGMTTSIVLPDSTVVYLNSESSLRYPSTFEGSTRREVELKGEAYFEVTKDVDKHFIVATAHQSQIEVLGTSFNVEAYENMPDVSTTLIEGKVNFSYRLGGKKKLIQLKPGEKVVYDAVDGKANLYATSGDTEISWKDGKIIFNDTSLKDALHVLEKRYNVEFVLRKSNLTDNSFTGTFTNERLDCILEYFELTSNFRWKYLDEMDKIQRKIRIEIY